MLQFQKHIFSAGALIIPRNHVAIFTINHKVTEFSYAYSTGQRKRVLFSALPTSFSQKSARFEASDILGSNTVSDNLSSGKKKDIERNQRLRRCKAGWAQLPAAWARMNE